MNARYALLIVMLGIMGCATSPGAQPLGRELAPPHPALTVRPIPEGLGVNIHFYEGGAEDWRMMAEAGFGIVRMDISWAGAEKEAGKYDFSAYDALVSQLEARQMRLLFIIDYGNPICGDDLAPHTDACRELYAKFCGGLAAHFAGKGILWELWNEPNIHFWTPQPNVDDYMAWCKAVVPAVRAADPNACIVGPATSRIDLDFLRGCFERGLLELVDGVSVHPYRDAKQGPETAVPEYLELGTLIEEFRPAGNNKVIPMLSGEWGYSSLNLSEAEQGKYLVRQWLTNTAFGIPISIWYDWHDDGPDPNEKEHHFGTVTLDYQPKPAFTAMKTLVQQLRGYTFATRHRTDSQEDYVLVFEKESTRKIAAWTTGVPHTITLGPAFPVTDIVDHLGAPRLSLRNGTLELGDAPCYVSVEEP